jgi:hypothetical protein
MVILTTLLALEYDPGAFGYSIVTGGQTWLRMDFLAWEGNLDQLGMLKSGVERSPLIE